MRSHYLLSLATLTLALASAGLTGCGEPPHGPPAPTGTPKVGVIVLQPQRVAITTELPGRTSPYQIAEVRPQVSGIVQARPFREGSDVAAGATLYQIDAAPYQASYDSAVAALYKSQANLQSARLKAQRYRELVAIKAVSQQDADDTATSLQQAEADVASSQAALETSRINLAYTRVTAPIAGRIGRSSVTAGALVTANQTTALATVQQLDPIYVDVTQASAAVLRLRQALARGDLKAQAGAATARVRLLLEDGTPYALEGRLQFSEVTVDTATGAITLRAVFPNPRGELLPGMYVRAVLEEGVDEQALLVPQAAVGRDGAGKPTAWVVGADGKLQARQLETARTVGDQWLVRSGLQAGDRLVVDGQQSARPGLTVQAVAWAASAAAVTTAGSSSTAPRSTAQAAATAPAVASEKVADGRVRRVAAKL